MKEKPANTTHPSLQFLILVAITIGLMFVGALIGIGIVMPFYGLKIIEKVGAFDTTYPGVVNSLWILQITSTTIPLFVGPVIFARYVMKEPREYLHVELPSSGVLFALGLVIMLFSTPLMEVLVNINQKMVFPHWAKGIYDWMRRSEDEAGKETSLLLQMNSLGAMLFDLLVIGLLTAIAEEFLFRGAIQTIFTRWTNNIHWGIWITAILFSAFHMQFFGFLPRLLLGVFFGYFVAYSGSIWTGVWGHFINNGTAVVMTYLFQQKLIHISPDDQHVFNYGAYAFSVIFTAFLFVVYRNIAQSKKALLV